MQTCWKGELHFYLLDLDLESKSVHLGIDSSPPVAPARLSSRAVAGHAKRSVLAWQSEQETSIQECSSPSRVHVGFMLFACQRDEPPGRPWSKPSNGRSTHPLCGVSRMDSKDRTHMGCGELVHKPPELVHVIGCPVCQRTAHVLPKK